MAYLNTQFLPSRYTLEETDDLEFTVGDNSSFQITIHEAQVPEESTPIYLHNETFSRPDHVVSNDEMIN
jgi:hypothetical protein